MQGGRRGSNTFESTTTEIVNPSSQQDNPAGATVGNPPASRGLPLNASGGTGSGDLGSTDSGEGTHSRQVSWLIDVGDGGGAAGTGGHCSASLGPTRRTIHSSESTVGRLRQAGQGNDMDVEQVK